MNLAERIKLYMSLREPQAEALRRLEQIAAHTDFKTALPTDVAAVTREYVEVNVAFDTDFPSFCFALATGVGKTRLMGACIYLLWRMKSHQNFFILAPNTTIYNKLRRDLVVSDEKYMFLGLSEFPPPRVYDGDNYQSYKQPSLYERDAASIFLFNIQKIIQRGGQFKFHKWNENLGNSFASILETMDDLVILMDESHRYRAPASLKAINNLRPALGLEFTATPKYAGNILYSFSLGEAIGRFVKTPTVVTRTNLTLADETATETFHASDGASFPLRVIERIKLQDGILLHERKKARLAEYCESHSLPLVKPFVLISTRDTGHAKELRAVLESSNFFGGRYKGKVIEIHSNQAGEESEENIEKLLSVESADNPVEVVIHVQMLKEGWDVKNLYTIIPMRASVSEILTEQTIGRGLRLPFPLSEAEVAELGHTDPDIIELEIISHDRYEEIIREARTSNIFKVKQIDDDDTEPVHPVYVPTLFSYETHLALEEAARSYGAITSQQFANDARRLDEIVEKIIERQSMQFIQGTIEPIRENQAALEQPSLFASIASEEVPPAIDIQAIKDELRTKLREEIKQFAERNIDIPRITTYVEPRVTVRPFIPVPSFDDLQIVEQRLRFGNLASGEERSGEAVEIHAVEDPRRFLAARLIEGVEELDISDKELVFQIIDGYLAALNRSEEELKRLVHLYRTAIIKDLQKQILENLYDETQVQYKINSGFVIFDGYKKTIRDHNGLIDLRAPLTDRAQIRRQLFEGLRKSFFDKVAFDSMPERDFAIVLESDPDVTKWLRPPLDQMPIYYQGGAYNLDFVVETKAQKYLIEIKAQRELADKVVLNKARAAVKWCEIASQVDESKAWAYKLVPDMAVRTTDDFAFITSQAVKLNGRS
jgi:type III restriction enzyme